MNNRGEIEMIVDINDIESYDQLLDDNGKNISKLFPLSLLRNKRTWDYKKGESPFGGTMPKMFLRCDSKYFQDLIQALRNGNSSYVTYINDLVESLKESKVEDFPMSKLSVMLKSVHNEMDISNEESCSAFANVLGVPTVYNKIVDINGKKFVMSVDLFKDSQEVCEDVEMIESDFVYFDDAEQCIKYTLMQLVKDGKITEQRFNELMEEFIETYIYRKLILGDRDFKSRNVGLIRNTSTNEYSWLPNHDYELAFFTNVGNAYIQSQLKRIASKYPNTLDKIMTKFRDRLQVADRDSGKVNLTAFYRADRVLDIYSQSQDQVGGQG